ncbi:restriction endonuclease subunit S [Gudongella oleilytica]|uniref:restriction endonuclease subunit S n=1 Tax=Gudongella oleilytica TaxID=1582259 RepID=UPI000FF8B56E|nr:restriction endonuclease subunit S [Gudongella oleilytica]
MSFSEWREVKLEDVVEFYNGKKRPDNYGNLPVYGGNGILDYCDSSNTSGENIIIGRVGAYCGNVYYYDGKCWISDNAILVQAKEGYDSKYLYYHLFARNLHNLRIGSSQPLITQGILKQVQLTCPPLQEQKAIAHILSTLDEKIEVNNKINKTLEEMAQAIFKHWFVDFKFPNEDGEPYKSSGGEMVDSELGPIPKGWEVGSIYSIADFIYGAPFSSKLFNELGEGLPIIRIRDLKTGSPQFFTTEKHMKETIIEAGDILIGMDAEFRPTIWRGKKALLNQRVCLLKPKNNHVHKYYLYELIKPYMRGLEFSKTGTTVIHFGKSDVDRIRIINPNSVLLEKFNHLVDPIHQKIVYISKENQVLESIRDTLLPKLMSGEIRVPIDNEQ